MTNFEEAFKTKARRSHETSLDRAVAGLSEHFDVSMEIIWEVSDCILSMGDDPLNQRKYMLRSEELARQTNDPQEFLATMLEFLEHFASITVEFVDIDIQDELIKLENLANQED